MYEDVVSHVDHVVTAAVKLFNIFEIPVIKNVENIFKKVFHLVIKLFKFLCLFLVERVVVIHVVKGWLDNMHQRVTHLFHVGDNLHVMVTTLNFCFLEAPECSGYIFPDLVNLSGQALRLLLHLFKIFVVFL